MCQVGTSRLWERATPNTCGWYGRAQVEGAALVDVMVAAGLMKSKSEARRMIKQGGVAINNRKTSDEAATLDASVVLDGKLVLLTAGKKNKMLVRVQ
jgi:tyrosyl-tRNA synthetase